MTISAVKKELRKRASKEKAESLRRFFKTGPGEYGEGDIFAGVTVPEIRKIAKKFQDAEFDTLKKLMTSPVHEERMLALMILAGKYEKSKDKDLLFEFYMRNIEYVNNWDLVDLSAPEIAGKYLLERKKRRDILYKLARSGSLWERRISIIATLQFIKNREFADTIKIAGILMSDKEDLIHKAAGWMLREVGKWDMPREENFLRKVYKKMPRTMLRYAIEKFPEKERRAYLKGEI